MFIQKQPNTKAACDTCVRYHQAQLSYHTWLAHSGNPTPGEVALRNAVWVDIHLSWLEHTDKSKKEREEYLKFKEECQNGKWPNLLNLGIDAKELIQLPQLGSKVPKVSLLAKKKQKRKKEGKK